MEEIKGMSDHEARNWLMKHGYGLGEIDAILNTAPAEDPNAAEKAALMRQGYGIGEAAAIAAGEAEVTPIVVAEEPAPAPAPEPVKAAPAPKVEPAPAPAPAPKVEAAPAEEDEPKKKSSGSKKGPLRTAVKRAVNKVT